jgi:class 3 adenylate cyclase
MIGWGVALGCHAAPLIARGRSKSTRPAPPADDGRTSMEDMASTVGSERPSLRTAAAPDGTVTILFSDIESSTAINERLGDVRWLELLRSHHAIVREQVHQHGGFEVKAQGDGFMIAFPSARRAVQCARAIQDAIDSELGEGPAGPIRLRIGLHTGEAIKEEADFYGVNITLAARIADRARGGEILASSVVKQLTESAGDLRFENGRELELDGLAGKHTVYKVL